MPDGEKRIVRSRNAATIEQLKLACRHFDELVAAGVGENLAIRTLEILVDLHAKVHSGGNAAPHVAKDVELWSVQARILRSAQPDAKTGTYCRVEHGTPKRAMALKVRTLAQKNELTETTMKELVDRYYRLAVITLEEDRRLNRIARATAYDIPEDRWAAAGIEF